MPCFLSRAISCAFLAAREVFSAVREVFSAVRALFSATSEVFAASKFDRETIILHNYILGLMKTAFHFAKIKNHYYCESISHLAISTILIPSC